MASVSFFTFCHKGDFGLIHKPGQLWHQITSNNYHFDSLGVINQCVEPKPFDIGVLQYHIKNEQHIDEILFKWGIDLTKPQYTSKTDKAHQWRYHVVNHIYAAQNCHTDYIVFADNDCWIVDSIGQSWVTYGMAMLELNPLIWMVSPNDGEEERMIRRVSQQMFLVRARDFKAADFNQPGWDGDTNIPGGPMPEYWGMLEGRIELWLRHINKYRYVLPAHYRYWHHNRIENGQFVTDKTKYV